ncbi:MAG: hypothetical protein BWY95_02295 [Bacteroidetes bacterium ADurb.BinA104]|nr:MAG: hypothetical protein BWY95_02295 [Bacteroidetes bacterium ADurb.BinA104]
MGLNGQLRNIGQTVTGGLTGAKPVGAYVNGIGTMFNGLYPTLQVLSR